MVTNLITRAYESPDAMFGKLKRKASSALDLFADDESAQASAKTAVNLIVGLMVGGLVAAFLLPVAIDEIVAVSTSSWGSGASSLWGIMDLILVLAAFLFFIGVAVAASDNV